jgi:arylsulfatase A-like enzyme
MGIMDTSVPFLTDQDGSPQRYPLNDWYRTPGMERLAERGIRFNQFYAMSVCSPTRLSIMNGQNAARHRATNWIDPERNNAGSNGAPDWNWAGLKAGDVTLPSILHESGYRTIHIGKAHFGPDEHEGAEPLNLGFDVNVAGASFGAPGSYFGEENYGKGTSRSHQSVPHLDHYHGTDVFLTEALTLEAQKHVAATVESGRPFYLYFSHYAVHTPFQSDPRFADHYRHAGRSEDAQAFATLIEGMDKSLNDMLDQFDALGIAENTLVVFLGDNGSDAPLGDQHGITTSAPLRGRKGTQYEGGVRVPFIAAWARPDVQNPHQQRLPIAVGEIQGQMASVMDLFPTLLALTDNAIPDQHVVDGARLDTLLAGRSDPTRDETFLMHYPHGLHRSSYFTTWRDGDWKVVYHYFPERPTLGGMLQSDGQRYELFNLDDDPSESTNLADSHPKQLETMMRDLNRSLEEHHALYPVDDFGQLLKPRLP